MKRFDVVDLVVALPEDGLDTGAVGTIIDEYPTGDFEVEFADSEGRTIALLALRPEQIRLRRT